MNLNSDFIQQPLVFATNAANKPYLDKSQDYIYLWDSPLDGLPIFLVVHTENMDHSLIKRMHSYQDFKSESIIDDIINLIKSKGLLDD